MHKISCNFYDMRKFLSKKIWSQGTHLGSMGSGSQESVTPGPCGFQILVIWGLYEPLVLEPCQIQAKTLKTAGAQCAMFTDYS